MWLLIAAAACADNSVLDEDEVDAKLARARFYMQRLLPEVAACRSRVLAGAADLMRFTSGGVLMSWHAKIEGPLLPCPARVLSAEPPF